VQELLTDLYDRPEFVHKAIDRLVNAYLSMLDQFEDQDLLRLNNTYYRIGSGGLGYTDELPAPDYDPGHVRAKDLWGSGAAQIFSDVSPRMHWEFAMQYEVRWLSRFGLNYYGCCDPLHRKMGILEKIPNLRKVSMSPWVDIDQAVANVGNRYVFSYKPNPAVFARKDLAPRQSPRRAGNGPDKGQSARVRGRSDNEGHQHVALRAPSPMGVGGYGGRSNQMLRGITENGAETR